MAAIRWELEDPALKFLEPEAYATLTKKIRQRRKEREILEMHMVPGAIPRWSSSIQAHRKAGPRDGARSDERRIWRSEP
jgi:hypothetical protein